MADDGEVKKELYSAVESNAGPQDVKLEKTVTVIGGIGLIVGSMIGSGIFLSPSSVLEQSGSIGLSLIIWTLCGLLSLLGALCYGELGTAIQKSGAEYSYLFEAFGPLPAFLFSWTGTLIIRPSAGAIIAMIFAEYVSKPFFDDGEVPAYVIKLLALLCLAIITIVNCFSVKWAVYVQNVFTFAKIGCIILLVIIGAIELGKGNTEGFDDAFNMTTNSVGEISLSLYSGLWAYDGWNTLNYVTEEMRNPARDMPLTLIISMLIVVVCYLLANVAYIAVLGRNGVLASTAVALELGNQYLGAASFIIPVLVGLSCFGAVNGLLFGSGRLVYAAAREGHMPQILSMVQTKQRTPLPSLLFTFILSLIMLIPDAGKFGTLIDFFSFASWVFYGGCFVALVYLRFKRKDMNRPYKVFLPIPIFMILVALFLTVIPIYQKPVGSLYALIVILVGVPVYIIFVKFHVMKFLPESFREKGEAVLSTIQKVLGLSLPHEEKKEEDEQSENKLL